MSGLWGPLALAVVGLFLSAFFSGSETGFYRVARVRLVLDALGGDPIARGLFWLTNRPSLFVATTLVGNNLANYLTSLAIVLVAQRLTPGPGHLAELVAPIALTPLLFVYGELLPKNLFLRAPNRLLRKGGPLFLLFTVAFLPVSIVLGGLNKVLAWLLGASPQQVRLALARRELERVLEEGHEAGILHPSQRGLAQGIFALAKKPVRKFATPLRDVARARSDMTREELLRLARRYQLASVPVEDAQNAGHLIGYVRAVDLSLRPGDWRNALRTLMRIGEGETHLAALMRMQSAGESLALLVDKNDQVVGLLRLGKLREKLFGTHVKPNGSAYL